MTSVYLAGPEVFFRDGRVLIERKRAICRELGLVPAELHGEFTVSARLGHNALGLAISERNEILMDAADICVANLTPFRGPSADAGTVFELGYMIAQGKPAFGYTNDPRDYGVRVAELANTTIVERDGGLFTSAGEMVENHGMADNLMLEGSIRRRGHVLLRADAPSTDPWGDLTTFRRLVEHIAQKA
jgi:nucleoside 2-deoxyribosyltransferase